MGRVVFALEEWVGPDITLVFALEEEGEEEEEEEGRRGRRRKERRRRRRREEEEEGEEREEEVGEECKVYIRIKSFSLVCYMHV